MSELDENTKEIIKETYEMIRMLDPKYEQIPLNVFDENKLALGIKELNKIENEAWVDSTIKILQLYKSQGFYRGFKSDEKNILHMIKIKEKRKQITDLIKELFMVGYEH